MGTDSDRAVLSILSRHEGDRQERWEEAVHSIDFLHSSRKAWSTINKLTGKQIWTLLSPVPRLGKLHRLAAHDERGHTGPGIASPPGSSTSSCPTNGRFQHLRVIVSLNPEIAAALRRLKPGECPGLDSIFPELILHTGSALKSWFCTFLTSCMRPHKIQRSGEEHY